VVAAAGVCETASTCLRYAKAPAATTTAIAATTTIAVRDPFGSVGGAAGGAACDLDEDFLPIASSLLSFYPGHADGTKPDLHHGLLGFSAGVVRCESVSPSLVTDVSANRGSPISNPNRRRAYGAWVVVCLVWGTTYLGIRICLETIPPLLMAAFRWIAAGSLLIAALKIRGERMPPRRSWPSLALLGLLLLGFGNGAVVWAELTVPSGLTAVLVAMSPFWMVGIDAIMSDGEALTVRRVAGLIVGFAGIVMLVWPDIRLGGGRAFLGGVIATQIACLGWAIGSTYARRRGP
jgi:EamA-like transporter family